MKRLTQLLAMAVIGLSTLAVSEASAMGSTSQENEPSSPKFWICTVGNAKQARTAIRVDSIVSVNKHSYSVNNVVVKECTIDTLGNNSIRFYCMNNNEQVAKMKERTSNTQKLIDSKTGGLTTLPAKAFPEGTYSHNIEYMLDSPSDIDKIYDSALNAVIKNRGTNLKVN